MITNRRFKNILAESASRWLFSARTIFIAVVLLVTTPGFAETITPQSIIRISASEQATNIYQQALKISQYVSNTSLDASRETGTDYNLMIAMSSPGSLSNVQNLVEGRAEFGIVEAGIANAMYTNPKKWGVERAIERVRLVTTLQPSLLHIIVPVKNSGPTALTALKNATVAIGLPSAKTQHLISDLLAMHDLPIKEMKLRYFPFRFALRQLREKSLDAVIVFDQAPNPQIAALLDTGEYTLLPLDRKVMEEHRYADEVGCKIASNLPYNNLPTDFFTASVDNYLLVQNTVSPAIVTTLVQQLGDVADTSDSPIPLHDAVSSLRSDVARIELGKDPEDPSIITSEQATQ